MPIRIVPPSGSEDTDARLTNNSGPARLGRKTDIENDDTLDTSDYPYVDIHVNADLEETVELNKENFTVYEEGKQVDIDAFDFRASSLDLVFIFDDTGSMSDEIDGAKRGITKLTNAVADRNIDAQYGLVSFKDDVEVDQRLTSDADQIKHKIDHLSASGGGDYPEANFDAIEEALGLNLRKDAETVFVDITDAISHFRNDGSGYSDYLLKEVASDLNEAGITFISIAPDRDQEGGEIYFDDPEKGSLKKLAGEVGGLWTDIDEEDFDWVLERIIAMLVGTYVIRIHTCTPPGDQRSVTVKFDHDRFGSDSDTALISIPESQTLPPECEEEKLKRAGESGIDTRTGPVSNRDGLNIKEGSDDDITKSGEPDSETIKTIPLAIEPSTTSVSLGETVDITVRDPNGRVADANVIGPGIDATTSGRGDVSVTLESEGEIEIKATGPEDMHTPATTVIEVNKEDSSGVSKRPDSPSAGTSNSDSNESSSDSENLTPLIINPERDSVSPGDNIQFTVRSKSGDRVEGATLTTERGHAGVTDSRGNCEFVFKDKGEMQVTVTEVEGGEYQEASVRIQVN